MEKYRPEHICFCFEIKIVSLVGKLASLLFSSLEFMQKGQFFE